MRISRAGRSRAGACLLWIGGLGAALAAAAPPANTAFDSLASQASAARQANRLDDAMTLYRQALALKPDWAEGWWYLGTLHYDRDAYADAVAAFAHAVALQPGSSAAVAMLGLGEARIGRTREALGHLERARALGVGDAGLRRVVAFTTGTLELERGNYGAAQEVLDELARDGVAEDELMLALGQAVLGLRPVDAADAGSQRVLRAAGHAEWLAARSDVAGATREYQQLAAEAPAFHNVQFALGRFLVATHQDEAAVAAFQRELDNTPNHLLARLGLAGVLLATDPARALPYAEQAVRLNPGLGEAHYLLGAALLGTGQTSRALAELETARHIGPEQAKLYYALARAYAKLGRAREAAQARQRFAILNARQQGPGGPPHGKQ